jgi:hypothetical protein
MPSENGHAAKIENGIVTQVIVIPRQEDDRDDLVKSYCNSIGLSGDWVDTSYIGARKNKYAGIGDKYVVDESHPDGAYFESPTIDQITTE